MQMTLVANGPFSYEMAGNLERAMQNRPAFTERFVFSERSVFTVPSRT